jgi:hypothetical protein
MAMDNVDKYHSRGWFEFFTQKGGYEALKWVNQNTDIAVNIDADDEFTNGLYEISNYDSQFTEEHVREVIENLNIKKVYGGSGSSYRQAFKSDNQGYVFLRVEENYYDLPGGKAVEISTSQKSMMKKIVNRLQEQVI